MAINANSPIKHPLQPDELDMLKDSIISMIREIKSFGVDPNNVTPDAAWAIFCYKTQAGLHRTGQAHLIGQVMSVYKDPVHSFREEFLGLWEGFLANQK